MAGIAPARIDADLFNRAMAALAEECARRMAVHEGRQNQKGQDGKDGRQPGNCCGNHFRSTGTTIKPIVFLTFSRFFFNIFHS